MEFDAIVCMPKCVCHRYPSTFHFTPLPPTPTQWENSIGRKSNRVAIFIIFLFLVRFFVYCYTTSLVNDFCILCAFVVRKNLIMNGFSKLENNLCDMMKSIFFSQSFISQIAFIGTGEDLYYVHIMYTDYLPSIWSVRYSFFKVPT